MELTANLFRVSEFISEGDEELQKFYWILYNEFFIPQEKVFQLDFTDTNREVYTNGKIDLLKLIDEDNKFSWIGLEEVIRVSVRFLDNLCSIIGSDSREITLILTNWDKTVDKLNIIKDSPTDLDFESYTTWFVLFFSILESNVLSEEKGECIPNLIDRDSLDSILNHKTYSKGGFDINNWKMRNQTILVNIEA